MWASGVFENKDWRQQFIIDFCPSSASKLYVQGLLFGLDSQE